MKILKLRIKNINSLAGLHTVDFSDGPLASAGIFAITGPTGSGKTTLLDAITLALFNRTPRFSNISSAKIGEQGSIVTHGTPDAQASVVYKCAEGTFESTWSISQNRNGNWRDYHMEIKNYKTDELLDLRKRDVPAKNEAFIGLDYGQFVKSLLLSQGEFAAFVKADRNEKYALLEKLTGGEIYRLIGQRVFELAKEAEQALKLVKGNLEQDRWAPIENLKSLQQDKSMLEKVLPKLNFKVAGLQKDLEASLNLQKQQAHLADEEATLAKLQKDQQELHQHSAVYERHEQAFPLKGSMDAFETQKASVEKNKAALLHKAKDLSKLEDEVVKLHSEAQQILKQEVEDKQLAQTLEILESEFARRQKELKDAQVARDEARSKLQNNKYLLFKNHQHGPYSSEQMEQWLKKIEEEKAKIPFQNLDEADVRITELEQEKKVLHQWYEALREYQRLHEELDSWTKQVEANLHQVEIDQPKAAALARQLEHKEALLEAQQKIVKQQAVIKSMEEQRHQLVEGEPCPLCGATNHPWAAGIKSEPDVEEALLTQLRSESKELSKSHQDLLGTLRGLMARYEQGKQKIAELQSKLTTVKQNLDGFVALGLSGDAQQAMQENMDAIKACGEWKTWFQRGENYRLFLHFVTEAEVKQAKWQKEHERFNKDFAHITHDAIRQIRSQWKSKSDQLQNQNTELNTLNEALGVLKTDLENAGNALLALVQEAGFETPYEARTAIRPTNEVVQWKAKCDELAKNITASETRLESFRKAVEELVHQGYSVGKLEELQAAKQEADKQLLETSSLLGSLGERIREALALKKEKERLEVELETKESAWRDWATLRELIGDATGNKFSNKAQAYTLNLLVYLANQRLSNLNPRYQIKADEDELFVIDLHMANHQRSVQTLSGGEIFLLSLAMALALSDLAAQQIQIETMFIDEGFGSLDVETLDLAMSTLETLQASTSKTLGIISHVETLKERFATKIVLRKGSSGHSSLIIEEPSVAFA